MKNLDALAAEVAATISLEQSAVTLITGLAAQIQAAGTDPAKLQDLTDQLTAQATALAAAITANTTPPAPAATATTDAATATAPTSDPAA